MKIILSREEIKELVKKALNIETEFILEINNAGANKETTETIQKVVVDSNNFVQEVTNQFDEKSQMSLKDELESYELFLKEQQKDVKEDDTYTFKDVTTKKVKKSKYNQESNVYIPKKPRIDYTIYKQRITDFLMSPNDTMTFPTDGLKVTGIRSRYDTAAKMLGKRELIKFDERKYSDRLVIQKR